jgi:hypothetical protein
MRLLQVGVTTCYLPLAIMALSQQPPMNIQENIVHSTSLLVDTTPKISDRRHFFSTATSLVTTSALVVSNPSVVGATAVNSLPSSIGSASDLSWPLGKVAFSLLPLAGTFTRRATVEECIVKDTIWTHDQVC